MRHLQLIDRALSLSGLVGAPGSWHRDLGLVVPVALVHEGVGPERAVELVARHRDPLLVHGDLRRAVVHREEHDLRAEHAAEEPRNRLTRRILGLFKCLEGKKV